MSNLIAIIAPPGSGKSTSLFPINEGDVKIEGLDPKETLLINIAGKPLPVRGASRMYPPDIHPKDGGNYIETSNPETIRKAIKLANEGKKFKNVVLDDAGYIMGFDVMNKAKTKGYEKWTEIAAEMFQVINDSRTARRDLNVICIFHQEKGDDGKLKIKTAGKLIDNTISLDGLFTFILYATVEKDFATGKVSYKFRTKSDGESTCKTPLGCFKDELIPNDMGLVVRTIDEYYNG